MPPPQNSPSSCAARRRRDALRVAFFGPFSSQGQAFPLLLRHREVCQPAGAAGVSVPDHTGISGCPNDAAFFFKKREKCPKMKGSPPPPLLPCSKICVSKCPDRFMTYLTASKVPANLEYYRQFCVPEFRDVSKVRRAAPSGDLSQPSPRTSPPPCCPHPGSHRGAEGQGVPGHALPQHPT